MKKIEEIKQLAEYYGFDIKDISNNHPYSERKGKTLGIVDRRNNRQVASYSAQNTKKIEEYFKQFHIDEIEKRRREEEEQKRRYYSQPQHQIEKLEEEQEFI